MLAARVWVRRLNLTLLLLIGSLSPAFGQKLSPRAYWPAPVGTKVLSLGVAYQRGEVVTDPALAIEGAEATLTALQVGYVQIVSLGGRTASLAVVIPRLEGTFRGIVDEAPARLDLEGAGDVSLILGYNFLGAPAMTPKEFQTFRQAPKRVLGLSFELRLPTGQYDPARIVNLGGNRWAIKPEIGYLIPMRRGYVLEMALGAWIYGDNDEFLGETRSQDPLFALAIHLVRRQKGPFWTSLDLNFYTGGRSLIAGERNDDRLRNSRLGATIVFPFKKGHALRFAGSTSIKTDAGGSYNSFLIAYLKAWR